MFQYNVFKKIFWLLLKFLTYYVLLSIISKTALHSFVTDFIVGQITMILLFKTSNKSNRAKIECDSFCRRV